MSPRTLADMTPAESALRAVMGLHAPVECEPSDTICTECSPAVVVLNGEKYYRPIVEWPCPTVLAIGDALGLEVKYPTWTTDQTPRKEH